MKSSDLKMKFNAVFELQVELFAVLKKLNSGEIIENDLGFMAQKIENKYDEFKGYLYNQGKSHLTKFQLGSILPRDSYYHNQATEAIVCLESWRWVHLKLFHY